MVKKREKTKWELKRERLMSNPTYRHIIVMAEVNSESLERWRLAEVTRKLQHRKYSALN